MRDDRICWMIEARETTLSGTPTGPWHWVDSYKSEQRAKRFLQSYAEPGWEFRVAKYVPTDHPLPPRTGGR